MEESAWFIFLLLPCWCLHYIRRGCSGHQKVSARFKGFMVGNWSSFQKESSHASCVPHSHHSWKDSSTICFHQCLTLGKAVEYNCATRAFQPMTPVIFSKDTIVVLRQLHPLHTYSLHLFFTISLNTPLS
jgi:hypothetical protein